MIRGQKQHNQLDAMRGFCSPGQRVMLALNADYLFITIILALCRCFDLFYCVKCAGVLITGIDYTFGFYTDRCLL
ncbi:hypothetical protein C1N58_19010 [Pantoea sp. SGAir0180]|jgi:hypothetical protein|uniref:Uncharacterized protein n=1 Tax=Pantoea stewartii TaxID=66269 RepID=A0AB34VCC6_9GAMM|nr:hypothetical protein HA47_04925 [Pantoea stewartii subsp. indologenes]KHE02898.1 hypothetical protein NL54_02575 [Pantoea stewartii]KKW52152.1 hypothetical protein XB02_01930 [Pantoea ananatis]KHN60039.1 hypothetical protein OI73_19255 [Pantoea stewartii]KTS29161.1 hypothetical protein NS381_05385 [Pantoea stewartii]